MFLSRSPFLLLVLLGVTGATPPTAPPVPPPVTPFVAPGFVQRLVVDSLASPTAMAFAPDGRIFVCEQSGRVRVIRNGRLLRRPFITVPTIMAVEQGLVGIALDPAFATNRCVYLTYTSGAPVRHQVVARCVASGDTARTGSLRVLYECDENLEPIHVGGGLVFGRDRKLYLGTGDNDEEGRSQSLRTTHGKLLRLNPDGSIPDDNPFATVAGGRYRAIWARGLRNAFGLAVEPRTGRLFINDVGGAQFEEVNVGARGANYGWPLFEGASTDTAFTPPLHRYGHDAGCAITRGTFWRGRYYFAEYCLSEIRSIDAHAPDRADRFAGTLAPGPVDLGVGRDGDLYCLVRGTADPGGNSATRGRLIRILAAPAGVSSRPR